MRITFNDGQEAVRSDFNDLQAAKEQEFYDRVIYEMNQRAANAFFGGSFLVSYTDATHVSVAAGLGFQTDSTQVGAEPQKRPLYLSAASPQVITAAHATLNRIDIISVKADRAVTATASRRFKSTVTALPTTQTFNTQDDWQATILVTAGTANASPAVPSTPTGYIKIAEILVTAATGVTGSGSITDKRTLFDSVNLSLNRTFTGVQSFDKQIVLNQISAASVAAPASSHMAFFLDTDNLLKSKDPSSVVKVVGGSPEYDAIVGSSASANYATLALALAAASAGWKILVLENQTINTTLSVAVNNIEIVLKPGVTLSKGSATTGISIVNPGCKIKGGRIGGFNGGSDKAISVGGSANYTMLRDIRFYTNTTDVDDSSGLSDIIGCISE